MRLNALDSLLALLSLTAAACDSPGGKSGPCADDPALPQCQLTTATAATETPDATSSDVTIDIQQGDSELPPECVDGLTRCSANLVERCIGGRFIATEQCDGLELCVNGACVAQECLGADERCVADRHQRCVDNHWQQLEACDFGCDGTACKTHGEESCADLMFCAQEQRCELSASNSCIQGCAANGSEAAQATFLKTVGCYEDHSGEAALTACIPDHVTCLAPEHGSGGCNALSGCVTDCGSQSCILGCYAGASVDAQRRYLTWVMCGQLFCGGSDCQACFDAEGDCRAE